MCFSVLACYLPVSLDFTIHVNCYFGNGFESPKRKVQVGSSHWWCCHAHCGCEESGAGWVGGWISTQGGHSTFHLPKSLPTSFLWLLQLRSEERGKALWAGHVMGRAQSHLCSCLSCTVATSISWASLLSVSKLLHMLALPCSTSGAATLPGWGTEFLCACSSFARGPRMTLTVCASVSENHMLLLS